MNYFKFIMLLVIILITNSILSLVTTDLFPDNFLAKSAYKLFMGFFVLFLILKQQEKIKFTLKTKNFVLFIISVTLIIFSYHSVLNVIYNQDLLIEDWVVIWFLISCLSVGFFEELLFRVYTFNFVYKTNKSFGVIKKISITSFIFAIAHSTNFFNPDVYSLSVINQILFAFGIGFLLQTLYMKYNNLILIVTLHGLVNFFGGYKSHVIKSNMINNENSYNLSDFLTTFIALLILNTLLISFSNLLLRNQKNINE